MTIVELLERTHHDLDALFRDIDAAVAVGKLRLARELFRRLSTKLLACIHAERAVVYPRFTHDAELAAEVASATTEHATIEATIGRLRLGAMTPEVWRAGVSELRTRVADHAKSEEWVLFPLATLVLTPAELGKLADAFRAYEPIAASVAGPSITYSPPGTCDTGA